MSKLTKLQREWYDHLPAPYRLSYSRAIRGRNHMTAIRAKCLECNNWQPFEVRECVVQHCPLWPYRMGRMGLTEGSESTKNRQPLADSARNGSKSGLGTG